MATLARQMEGEKGCRQTLRTEKICLGMPNSYHLPTHQIFVVTQVGHDLQLRHQRPEVGEVRLVLEHLHGHRQHLIENNKVKAAAAASLEAQTDSILRRTFCAAAKFYSLFCLGWLNLV